MAAFHDFEQARAICEALTAVFARELGGRANDETYGLVCKLCDAAVEAVNDVDCRVAIRGVKSLSALLYSDDGHVDVHAGPLTGPPALRFQIANALTNFRGRLDKLQNRPPSRPEVPAIDKKLLRVLVVEDNHDSAESLRRLLEICGYAVTVAYTARDGFEAARELHPDVVLCDIGLPDEDGFKLAEALRHDPSTSAARLIAVTAYGTEMDKARSRKVGFEKHFVKPVNPAVLLDELISGAKAEPGRAALPSDRNYH